MNFLKATFNDLLLVAVLVLTLIGAHKILTDQAESEVASELMEIRRESDQMMRDYQMYGFHSGMRLSKDN